VRVVKICRSSRRFHYSVPPTPPLTHTNGGDSALTTRLCVDVAHLVYESTRYVSRSYNSAAASDA